MRTLIPAAGILVMLVLVSTPALPHPGALDGNGCHYDTATGRYHRHRDPRRNRDAGAPAKKSRENIRHDARSPNYKTLKCFVSYSSLQACLTSGRRAPGA